MTRSGKIIINKIERRSQKTSAKALSTPASTFQIATNSEPQSAQTRTETNETGNPFSNHISCLQRFEFLLALVNRLLIGFVTIYMSWMCLRLPLAEIPFHALLCTLGFVCLMAEGLLAHYRSNAWTQLCYRTERTRTHWLLQLCGSLLGLMGILVKIAIEEVHFHTLHGQLGVGVILLLLLSVFSGLSSLFAAELKICLLPIYNKGIHNVLGLATFTLAMCCMYTAFSTDIFISHSLEAASYMDFRLLLKISIIIISLLSSYGPVWCFIYSKLWSCY